jgi:methylmalonyl-CoA mutase
MKTLELGMTFPQVTLAQWRAQVDKELAGASYDDALVHHTPEGIAIEPLYTGATQVAHLGHANAPRDPAFRICMRADLADLSEHVEGGADALWLRGSEADIAAARGVIDPKRTVLVIDTPSGASELHLVDGGVKTLLSTVAQHEAGCDAVGELALSLKAGAEYLEAMLTSGADLSDAVARVALQVAVGRDTFGELAKLRALRVVWQKLLAGVGAVDAPRVVVHAVCSTRARNEADPWADRLRVTTQVFSAVLGGADLVTPASFDDPPGTPQAPGTRIARNTGLVLREESYLGHVLDPAGGSYYFETLTDGLAREGWRRFQKGTGT